MRTTVVIPTYNERDNLPLVVSAVLAAGTFHILIVDDDSPDGTGAVADALARDHPRQVEVLHRSGPRGLGRSYVDGLSLALAWESEFICQMDGDLSHDPKYLSDLVRAAGACDLAIGSRYLHGVSVVNWPLHRIALSIFANRYVRAVTRMRVHDCTSGFRCWRRTALAKLPLDKLVSDGYAFLVEMLYEAARGGLRIEEVPIVFVERSQGVSKVSMSVLVESLVTPWRLVLRRLITCGAQRDEPNETTSTSREEE